MSPKLFIPFSTSQVQSPHHSRSPSRRRYPLTPPTVTPPAISRHNSWRHEATSKPSSGSATKAASALLSKVASSPASRRCTPASSPISSPNEKLADAEQQFHQLVEVLNEENYPQWSGYEALKCWDGHEQRDGYISFPDFERYCASCEAHAQPEEHQQATTA